MPKSAMNGKQKSIVMVLSFALTLAMGLLGGGMWAGSVRSHIADPAIHPSPQDRLSETRVLFDRELWKMFEALQERLDKIDEKIDDLRENR